MRTTGKQFGLAATGVYQPSLRSPWLAANASLLIRKACLAEGVSERGLVLHSDNGSPMKGATMLATLQRLGVAPSFSRLDRYLDKRRTPYETKPWII